MTKLYELPPPDSDVRATLEDCLAQADGLDGVIVIALTKDTAPILRTSSMNAMKKAFLVQFLNAFMVKWFKLEEE